MADDVAAWAQAYLSAAAILASGALAVFVPWNERRIARQRADTARLDVECRRSKAGGLELTISYTPEFKNHSLGATVQLLEPNGARVYKGALQETRLANGEVVTERVLGALNESVTYNAVPLLRKNHESGPDVHQGVIFVEYPDERDGPRTAKIKINILSHGNYRIIERALRVSPINDAYYERGAPVAIIVGSKAGQ